MLDGVVYNWINTCEHGQGQMLWRWVKPGVPDEQLVHPKPKVVKIQNLRQVLSTS